MNLNTKCSYLKRNPVTATRQINYVLKNLWGKVMQLQNEFKLITIQLHIERKKKLHVDSKHLGSHQ